MFSQSRSHSKNRHRLVVQFQVGCPDVCESQYLQARGQQSVSFFFLTLLALNSILQTLNTSNCYWTDRYSGNSIHSLIIMALRDRLKYLYKTRLLLQIHHSLLHVGFQ